MAHSFLYIMISFRKLSDVSCMFVVGMSYRAQCGVRLDQNI